MFKISKATAAALALSTLTALTPAGSALAKGTGTSAGGSGGSKLLVLPAQCTSGVSVGASLIGKIQNNHQFGIQVAGDGAAGTWDITWVKNGRLVTTTTEVYTSGWGSFGLAANRFSDQGVVTFAATAVNRDTGETCTASGSVKI
jgi:hypothetical protein